MSKPAWRAAFEELLHKTFIARIFAWYRFLVWLSTTAQICSGNKTFHPTSWFYPITFGGCWPMCPLPKRELFHSLELTKLKLTGFVKQIVCVEVILSYLCLVLLYHCHCHSFWQASLYIPKPEDEVISQITSTNLPRNNIPLLTKFMYARL